MIPLIPPTYEWNTDPIIDKYYVVADKPVTLTLPGITTVTAASETHKIFITGDPNCFDPSATHWTSACTPEILHDCSSASFAHTSEIECSASPSHSGNTITYKSGILRAFDNVKDKSILHVVFDSSNQVIAFKKWYIQMLDPCS